ncbi:catalase-like [Pieris rapae]|uniref:catalase-like n=1 Tax=Pieris rapae TaxID=64459 RepID=UPI001E28114B|nr:catalase-like [Pieris rapae]
MYRFIVLLFSIIVLAFDDDPAQQIEVFRKKTKGPIGIMTTSNGVPVPLRETTSTLNTRLLFNEYLLDSITHIFRERIPERFVHAKGGGAFGYFEVTHDISHITKAKIFSAVGKRTPIVARFSPINPERGGNDLLRDARGFAVRFYTEDGNFDFVGFNTEMFSIKDPIDFTMFTHTQKRNPATNLFDANMLWDFITLRPESMHIFLRVFGDRGIPDGYRYMPGFSIHTYQFVNEKGEYYFVRFHFIPDGGIRFLTAEQARMISKEDADYCIRDLYRAIEGGDYPSWTLSFQILTLDEVKNSEMDVFDVTRVLPIEKYPLHPVGKMVLNKNPKNYFAEVEQLAFSPSNLIPGILGGVDKIFEMRRLAYRSAQYHRLGANFNKIRVNCPFRSLTYNRDGEAPVKDNERDIPNYYPNSFNGPIPYVEESKLIQIVEHPPYNFDQARDLYENQLSAGEKERLVENILYSLGSVTKFLQEKGVEVLSLVSRDLASRVEQGLLSNVTTNYLDNYKK